MKKSLYQIEKEYLDIAEQLIETEGEVTPEIETALAISEHELEVKAVNYCFIVKEIESDIDTIDTEIKRLQSLKKQRESAVERLKGNIKNAMLIFGVKEIKTALLKINFRKSSQVVVEPLADLPKEFLRVKTTIEPDKKSIKDYLENGGKIEGCYIAENQSLQIK
jgi:hypothetical protein